jgi:hypothetical protein
MISRFWYDNGAAACHNKETDGIVFFKGKSIAATHAADLGGLLLLLGGKF